MSEPAYSFRPQAQEDVIELARHIAVESRPSAERFIDAVEATCGRLADLPHSGVARTMSRRALAGLRMMPVHGFETYLPVFYHPLSCKNQSGFTEP